MNERLAAALADRYRIERELGAGGMATVCLVQALSHDRKGPGYDNSSHQRPQRTVDRFLTRRAGAVVQERVDRP